MTNMCSPSGNTIEDGRSNRRLQMLNEGCHPTALQTVSDQVAIGAAETLLQQGIKIPEDISVAGFGNILVTEHFSRAVDDGAPAEVSPGRCGGGNDDGAGAW